MTEDKITVVSEDGSEKEYTILFTFSLEEFGKDYVAFFEEGEEELFVSSYKQDGEEDGGALGDITNDEEWNMIEEVIEAFLMEDEVEEA